MRGIIRWIKDENYKLTHKDILDFIGLALIVIGATGIITIIVTLHT